MPVLGIAQSCSSQWLIRGIHGYSVWEAGSDYKSMTPLPTWFIGNLGAEIFPWLSPLPDPALGAS